jgi:iron(III) transport system ATP-binding protein
MLARTVVCHHLHKAFSDKLVVKDVTFELNSGRILALLGPSGCGKTTTLRLIAGFERLDSGRIEIAGQIMADGRIHVPPEKRRVGMVFQDFAIFPHLSVADNIAFGLGKDPQAKARTDVMLEMVDLLGMGQQMPHELSGGQQQRVALARALALDPIILLLDEPFSNLDTSLRAQVREEVKDLLKANDSTAVFVTHDQEEALFLGDQIAVMNDGGLEQVGTPEEVYHLPETRFVAEFMGQTDFISGVVTGTGVETALGTLPQSLPLPHGTQVEVVVRPDDVDLRLVKEPVTGEEPVAGERSAESANGRISSSQFAGMAHIYQINLTNGTFVHSWQPHTLKIAHGTPVHATFRFDHPLTCFYEGEAV